MTAGERETTAAELQHQLRSLEQVLTTVAATDVRLARVREAVHGLGYSSVAQALEGTCARDGSIAPQPSYSPTAGTAGTHSPTSATGSPAARSQSVPQPLRQSFSASLAGLLAWALVVVVAAPPLLFILLGDLKSPASNNHPPDARSTSSGPVTTAIPPRENQLALPDVPDTGSSQPEPSTVAPPQEAATQMVIQSTLPPTEGDPFPAAPPVALSPPPTATPGTVETTAAFPTPLLDLGQIEDAKRVQRRLIDLGFLFGTADGNWGPRSRKALRDFLGAQGIGNSDTWDEKGQQDLFSATAARAPATGTFVGGWGIDADQCRQTPDKRSPVTISARRAEAFGATCQFDSTQRESASEWRIRATCADEHDRWNANIRLTLSGSRLTWTSERGTVTYLRCPLIWN
jgi:hypothetical protein